MKRDLKINFEELKNISVAVRGFQYALDDISSALDNLEHITYQDSGCLNDAIAERISDFRKKSADTGSLLNSVYNIVDEYCEAMTKYLTPEYISLPVESDRDSLYFQLSDIKQNLSDFSIFSLQNNIYNFFNGGTEADSSSESTENETDTVKQKEQSNYFKIQNLNENVIPEHISRINSEMDQIDDIYKRNVVKFENTDDDYKSKLKSIYKYFKNIDHYRNSAYIKLMLAAAIDAVKSFIKNIQTEIMITFTGSVLTVNSKLRKNDSKYFMSEDNLKTYYGYIYGKNSDFSSTRCAGSDLDCFPETENIINKTTKEPYTEYELKHTAVFNTEKVSQYGGNQGAPENVNKNSSEYIMMYDIASKNNSLVTPDNFDSYLKKMNSEGCGYVSLVNGIMCHYENDPEGFEKTFGYPMYKADNDLNYECLLTDIYSAYDNKFLGTRYNIADFSFSEDGITGNYDPAEDTTGTGTNHMERNQYLSAFMTDHGSAAEVKTLNYLCPQNFKEITDSGKTVLVSLKKGKLECENGETKQNINSHSMVVTGFTEDGRIIVSSWGERLFIDPDDPERVTHKSNIMGEEVLYRTGSKITFETLEIK